MYSKPCYFVLSLLIVGLMVSFSTQARAQDQGETPRTGAFRLSLEVPVIGMYHDKLEVGDYDYTHNYFQAGIGGGRAFELYGEELPTAPRVELGLGGKIGANLVLGAKIQATIMPGSISEEYTGSQNGDYYDDEDYDLKLLTLGLGVLPYLEILLGSNNRVVPFLYFTGGFRMDISRAKWESGDESETYTISTPRGVAGIGGGIHIFLGPRCSIDIAANGIFEMGKLKEKDEEKWDGETETDKDEYDIMRIGVDASLGISAWI